MFKVGINIRVGFGSQRLQSSVTLRQLALFST